MLDNRFELGLVTRMPTDERLAVRAFMRENLCLIMPVRCRDESWPALVELGFIGHPDGHEMATRLLSRRYPGKRLDHLPMRGFTNQIAMILEPVALGLGFTVLPRFAVDAFASPEKLRVVNGEPEVVDTLWLIHRAEWPLSAPAAWAIEALARAISPVPSV